MFFHCPTGLTFVRGTCVLQTVRGHCGSRVLGSAAPYYLALWERDGTNCARGTCVLRTVRGHCGPRVLCHVALHRLVQWGRDGPNVGRSTCLPVLLVQHSVLRLTLSLYGS